MATRELHHEGSVGEGIGEVVLDQGEEVRKAGHILVFEILLEDPPAVAHRGNVVVCFLSMKAFVISTSLILFPDIVPIINNALLVISFTTGE